MSQVVAVIAVSDRRDGRVVETEIPVHTLEEVYEACRAFAPMEQVRVCLKGEEGVLSLSIGAFLRV